MFAYFGLLFCFEIFSVKKKSIFFFSPAAEEKPAKEESCETALNLQQGNAHNDEEENVGEKVNVKEEDVDEKNEEFDEEVKEDIKEEIECENVNEDDTEKKNEAEEQEESKIKKEEEQDQGENSYGDDEDDDSDANCNAELSRLLLSSVHNSGDGKVQDDDSSSTDTWQSFKTPGRKRGKKKQKTVKYQPLQLSLVRMPDDDRCTTVLKNDVCELQQRLTEVLNENQMMTKLQHHHKVALQHFEAVQSSITETLTKHRRHIQVLKIMLHDTHGRRNNLVKQLKKTEHKLLDMKGTLKNLEQFSKDHSLLEREELTHRLAQTSEDLKEKDKKIQDLEKNLQLCETHYGHQVVNEQRKLEEERNFTSYLQEQLEQLSKETEEKTKKLEESHNYLNLFIKEAAKRGSECKMVQTEGLALLPTEAARLLELSYYELDEKIKRQSSTTIHPVHKRREETSVRSEVYRSSGEFQ
uniref:Lebercilin-like protein n=1 Tax=Cynoglossus semilaevis TaxID=244447 RepID=A0A3P8WCX5_CYNSE